MSRRHIVRLCACCDIIWRTHDRVYRVVYTSRRRRRRETEIQNEYYFRSCRGWFFFHRRGAESPITASRGGDDGGTGRIGLSRSGQAGYRVHKGPWELDHLCGLPRAVFTLRQHPAGFLFTPENPARVNRNLGACSRRRRRRRHEVGWNPYLH